MTDFQLYLASQSPRRREILDQIGVRYQVIASSIDETPLLHEAPAGYVERMASQKALAGREMAAEAGEIPVLGADTSVVIDDRILGKPTSKDDAFEMLQRLSGRTHQVMSAVAIATPKALRCALSVTEVTFDALDQQTIEDYWATGEPLGKAGSYAIQGLGAALIKRISGSYTGVVGLPVEILIPMLREHKIPVWQVP